jgi:Zn-dependent protease
MWLAAFNLIPFGMFDGQKIFTWNSRIWAVVAIPVWIITILPFLL